jgi:hypothetical protein
MIPLDRAFLPVSVAALVVAVLVPQARPDFSGRWTTDPVSTVAASPGQPPAAGAPAGAPGGRAGGRGQTRGDMGSGWGSTITISQDASRLTVEYAFFSRGDLQAPLRFVFLLDGSPSTNTVMMGRGSQAEVSRASWDGASLVLTTTHTFADPATGKPVSADEKRVLSMENPATLVVETTRSGVLGGPSSTTRVAYRKL